MGLRARLSKRLRQSKKKDIKEMQCVVHPWKGHKPATRCDVWRLFQRYYEMNTEPSYSLFLFVGWQGWSNIDIKIGLIQWYYDELPPARVLPIETAAKKWTQSVDGNARVSTHCTSYNDPNLELIVDPRGRFFYDPPNFVRLYDDDRMVAPVFFLTNHLTQEQRRIIIEELENPGGHEITGTGKGYGFVEWDQETDGEEENIWRLLWQVATYRGDGRTHCALFIDRESPNEKKVIIAETM